MRFDAIQIRDLPIRIDAMENAVLTEQGRDTFRLQLSAWFQLNARDLPWRQTRDPYRIWVSEVMLQQTRAATVIGRYKQFIERFPSIVSLAMAREEDVLTLWSGLGYFRRARMLHSAAQLLMNEHSGSLPKSSQELRRLPGVGDYTAAAIASIALGEAVAVVDGNVERVLMRVLGKGAGSRGASQTRLKEVAGWLLDPKLPGTFNQAMMELERRCACRRIRMRELPGTRALPDAGRTSCAPQQANGQPEMSLCAGQEG